MTKVTIVSTYIAIPDEGKMDLGDIDLDQTTIHGLKEHICKVTAIPLPQQTLWWRGYLLDQDESCIQDACVGVNADEHVKSSTDPLVVFLTTPMPFISGKSSQ
mmetsp:Transcript_27432/g.57448  ORF Transcript_27432/g.57448 Transcript_27432/m.57448 type:complete len:103 (-) Transcript_27432:158-466(-)|eukprot:CAMPEP_0172458798 /NCGR_PEP_ID=MMETSP1065-20121228/29396_1 /TAXON_ID=265537 /ORGANISM="Amphiprora paludosa, Strain CCMP125" /LENGTH=102 /DNA_ID=CAMNT_0013213211 /DNA_START=34 /DNA_END=342 /DNA_ORIENTATION=+